MESSSEGRYEFEMNTMDLTKPKSMKSKIDKAINVEGNEMNSEGIFFNEIKYKIKTTDNDESLKAIGSKTILPFNAINFNQNLKTS